MNLVYTTRYSDNKEMTEEYKTLVSVLVPIYNVEKYIERCCKSLFEQTYDNIEYIFVDDCTPDRSIDVLYDVLEKYPHRKNSVRVIRNQENKGSAFTRNACLEHSCGDFLMFVDSDDFIEKNTITKTLQEALKNEADIVVFGMKMSYNNRIKHIPHPEYSSKEEYISHVLRREVYLTVWGKLYNKNLFKGIKFIDGINFGEDYMLLPQLIFKAGNIAFMQECFYVYNQMNEGSYVKAFKPQYAEQLIAAEGVVNSFFKDMKTFHIDLLIGRSFIKSFLVESVFTNQERYKKYFIKRVISLYPEIDNDKVYKYIGLYKRIILELSKCNHKKTLTFIMQVRIALYKIKRFVLG